MPWNGASEAWSMVVPWVGIPLGDILKRFEPTSNARYVRFKTLHDPERMPGQRRRVAELVPQGGDQEQRQRREEAGRSQV